MSLITIAQAKAHLRIDFVTTSPVDPAEDDLVLKMEAAEHLVLDYIKVPMTSPPYWATEAECPPLVKAAILFQLGELFRFRGDDAGAIEYSARRDADGSLSSIVEGMLRRYRDPALA